MIETFTVSRDDTIYEAWPDVVLTRSGKLICVFSECTHHGDRSYTRIVCCESSDRGRTWSAKRPITEGTGDRDYYYNNARIGQLADGRVCVNIDKCHAGEAAATIDQQRVLLYLSCDEGATWDEPIETPVRGIVPDRLLELPNGRWIIAAHYHTRGDPDQLISRLWYSDNQGDDWVGPIQVAAGDGLNLCEATVLPIRSRPGTLVAFHRENSFLGLDCYKTISRDNGEHWSDPIRFPLPGCHRPVSGYLNDGRIMITYRFCQGGKGWLGTWTQNFFAAVTDDESALAPRRNDAWTRILPIDFDRSAASDLGYSGWVQFDDGEIYIVNYIVDDAPNGQIRGYSLRGDAFGFESPGG